MFDDTRLVRLFLMASVRYLPKSVRLRFDGAKFDGKRLVSKDGGLAIKRVREAVKLIVL